MESISALKSLVLEHLQSHSPSTLQGTSLRTEFPPSGRPTPLKRPMLVVGIKNAALCDAGMGGYLGEDENAALYGRLAEITMSFEILVPPSMGGDTCHKLYEELCDVLLFSPCPYGFYKLESGPISYGTPAGATSLTALGTMRAAFTKPDETLYLKEIQLQKKP